jgi:nucleotide-binding universal stress UspA family protein
MRMTNDQTDREQRLINEMLVCIEGSASGERAVDLAISLAQRLGARLTGLAIVDEPDIRSGAATGIGGSSYKRQRDDALVNDAEARVHAWLGQFEARCREARVPVHVLEERGRPEPTILEKMGAYDLTLMGRHANFKFETKASDPGTRDGILHRSRQPVLVVPEDQPIESTRVMIAFDGSSAAKRAIRSFADSGLAAERDLHVVCVDDDGANAWEMATRGVALFAEVGLAATPVNVVSVLPIADALIETRAKLGAGLMVMGAYTKSTLSEFVWGSVTRELVEKTLVPLLLQH